MMHRTCTWSGTRSPGLAVAAALALIGAGCGEPAPDEDGLVVEETSSAVASSLDLTAISESFAAPALLALIPMELARPRMLLEARSALLASVGNPLCVQVETMDTETSAYVEVVYDNCPGGLLWLLEIDGSLRADLAFETAPCGTNTCPTAVRFTLSTDYFRVGSRFGDRFAEIEGSWSLYDPLALGEATEWDSEFRLSNHRGSSLSMFSRASWVVAGGCVNLDFDGEALRDRPARGSAGDLGVGRGRGAVPERVSERGQRAHGLWPRPHPGVGLHGRGHGAGHGAARPPPRRRAALRIRIGTEQEPNRRSCGGKDSQG